MCGNSLTGYMQHNQKKIFENQECWYTNIIFQRTKIVKASFHGKLTVKVMAKQLPSNGIQICLKDNKF